MDSDGCGSDAESFSKITTKGELWEYAVSVAASCLNDGEDIKSKINSYDNKNQNSHTEGSGEGIHS